MAMSLFMSNAIIGGRKKRISKYHNMRFVMNGFEYRLVYEGGWLGFLTVQRRPEWKPRGRFEFVDTYAEDDLNMDDVIGFIKSKIGG